MGVRAECGVHACLTLINMIRAKGLPCRVQVLLQCVLDRPSVTVQTVYLDLYFKNVSLSLNRYRLCGNLETRSG